ncbi:MAG: hypothetical protein ACE5JV_00985 [Nitrososphaerales archaeon]
MDKRTAVVAVIIAVSVGLASSIDRIESQEAGGGDLLDSSVVMLDLKKMAAGDYIILYSSAPKVITFGSIVAKLPCDDNSEPDGWMLLGGRRADLSTFQPIEVELIQGTPGSLCAFEASIPEDSAPNVSGIILVNAGGEPIRLPRTSSVAVTVLGISMP